MYLINRERVRTGIRETATGRIGLSSDYVLSAQLVDDTAQIVDDIKLLL